MNKPRLPVVLFLLTIVLVDIILYATVFPDRENLFLVIIAFGVIFTGTFGHILNKIDEKKNKKSK